MIRLPVELLKGILIGAGGILPGISGASLAVAFGIYEEFTEVLAHPAKKIVPFFRRHSALCFGIASGFIIFTLLLNRLFSNHTTELIFLFTGFIAGTLPGIYRNARKQGTGIGEILSFCITAGFFIFVAIHEGSASLAPRPADMNIGETGAVHPALLVFAGSIIGAGSLLPGVSASFILIYFGLYGPLLDAVSNRNVLILLLLGSGALASVLLLSRLVSWLYHHFHGIVSFAVLGCTLGSLMLVFPGFSPETGILPCTILAVTGFASSFFLDRIA